MTHTQEQNQALLDGYAALLNDMLVVACEVRPVELILERIEILLTAEYPQRPVVKGTHRDILEGISELWKDSGTSAGKSVPAIVESICFHAPPRYGSGW